MHNLISDSGQPPNLLHPFSVMNLRTDRNRTGFAGPFCVSSVSCLLTILLLVRLLDTQVAVDKINAKTRYEIERNLVLPPRSDTSRYS